MLTNLIHKSATAARLRPAFLAVGGGGQLQLSFSASPFHSSPQPCVGKEWRRRHGLPSNPNACGPLTDGPDYSFVDGRATPPGANKIKRALKQREISDAVVRLSKEMDFAVEFNEQRQKQSQERKQEILNRKLKPKGSPLIQ